MLLGLLIAILIIAILYMIDLTAMVGHMYKNRLYAERPWFEEQRLLAKNAFPVKQTGKGGQTIISNETILAGDVKQKEENRGQLEITIEPNGLAKGHWQCEYEYAQSKTSYKIIAELAGNIDPTNKYEDTKGTNKKLLYFITKGIYKQIKTEAGGTQWPSEETIYVVGWIDNDYSAKGKLFLMTPEGGNAEYDWQTNADKNK